MWTVFVVLLALAARFTATDNKGERVYLHQLTIYKTHEVSFFGIHGTPQVYLSCEDGLPSVDMEQVTRTCRVYTFAPGAQPTTQLGYDGCVTCRLKERDFFTSDDVFGEWKMCIDDFEETGSHEVRVPGEFKALFECPVCRYVKPSPAPPPEASPAPSPEPTVEPAPEPLPVEPPTGPWPGVPPSSESVSDSDYDEIIDEMIRIDMEDIFDFDTEAKAQ